MAGNFIQLRETRHSGVERFTVKVEGDKLVAF
jgi:hypothetical protein